MGPSALSLKRCAIHTRTNRPWSLRECCEAYADRGIGGVSVWDDVLRAIGAGEAAEIIAGHGLHVPAYVRGGFFTGNDPRTRDKALDDNRRLLDEAATIGADMLVLVVGATPGLSLSEARGQVTESVASLIPHATQAGVTLAIEPLHPMYAADKSCINRLAEARWLCESLQSEAVGVAVDVYHTWWDPDLQPEIERLGRGGYISGFHTCDWRVETRDLLTDRGLMGDGVIDCKGIRESVERAGFSGWTEVEVFSEAYWSMDQHEYLDLIIERLASVA